MSRRDTPVSDSSPPAADGEAERLYDEYLEKPLGEKSHKLLHTHYAKRNVVK